MIDLGFQCDGAVATLTLKRPPANAFTPEGLLELQRAIGQLNASPEVRAVVVTGDGAKFFSAGADLNAFADGSKEVALRAAACFGSAFEALQNARPVLIAAINGYAMGGGLECALACDLRISEEHAQMALPETSVGLLPCGCGTQTLPWLVGEGWAKRMILTSERVDAQTALRIGLVEEVVEKGAAVEAALKMAERVIKMSPQGVEFSKALVHQARMGVPRHAALAVERERFVQLFDGPDQREGVNAFLEKRTPKWSQASEGASK
ncbi:MULTISPECIES: enoyl-CoA hydratase [Burkholderia cepacia complex]|uniref:enoyl-CoA hydratase n=1 Tax=Burkholderia cepacia complex TaxID=87882 RepID=UPI001CF158FB|nr:MULTISPECIES: enoyl-CoA hydratase [Burkholderia cepacia complex]MCA8057404.1 enoyl-CoA hydratase [Burkholderia cepacia]MDN7535260.1 enoyl-CoA hydratase [Burkholderia orbicola]